MSGKTNGVTLPTWLVWCIGIAAVPIVSGLLGWIIDQDRDQARLKQRVDTLERDIDKISTFIGDRLESNLKQRQQPLQ